MAGYLSPEWVDGLGLAAPTPGVAVRRIVTGGPDGDVTLESTLGEAGNDAGDGGRALTLTTPHDVATRLDAGELAVPVAYMQGKLKAEGDMPTLYALLEAAGITTG